MTCRIVDSIRVGAKALVIDRNQILLIQERRDDGSTFWTLPGGGIGQSETLAEGLQREVEEELQCETTIGTAIASCIYEHKTRSHTSTVYTIFEGELEGQPVPNGDENVIDHAWFIQKDIPPTTIDVFRHFLVRYRSNDR